MEALGLDVKLLTAQLINFVLFVIIFSKFMYKPFMVYIKQQHDEEGQRESLLKELEQKDKKADEVHKKILADAHAQASEITKEAESLAMAKRQEILDAAASEVKIMKEKAAQDIDSERQSLYDDVRTKVIKTSETMTEVVLRDFFSEKNQKNVMDEVLTKLKSSKVYEN
ncbi:ATP synthase F0 subunit B [Candidatus Woesebacteria bacterium]|nr:ATP synthase F0 subunit B [Candidatus Woesebacteria bacterium]